MSRAVQIQVSLAEVEEFKTICQVAMMAVTTLHLYTDGENDGGELARRAIAQIKLELAAINVSIDYSSLPDANP